MTSIVREGRATLILALPLMAGQVSQMLMGVVDTLMIGELGTVELAAATLAQTILHIPMMLGIGLAIAISSKVSQARGAGDPEKAREAGGNAATLAFFLGVLTFVVSILLLPILPYIGQDEAVVLRMPGFFIILAFSMIPQFALMIGRSHADSMEKPWPAFWIIFSGVLLNVFLNWLLIYGNFGLPRMGLEGAALATLISRIASLIGLFWWLGKSPALRGWIPTSWLRRRSKVGLWKFWNIAWPASLQVSAEFSAFIVASFIIGTLGAAALAAHQVAMTCVATIFMIPLGISMALTVRAGEAKGSRQPERLRAILTSSWVMGLALSMIFATVFFLLRDTIPHWFLTEPEPIRIAAALLLIAAFFQLGDHSQILSSGVLRGLDDVKTPAYITFFAHWILGVPLGLLLAFVADLGTSGMWWGLSAGLTASAVFLGVRAWKMSG